MVKTILSGLAALLLVSVLKFGWNVITADPVDFEEPESEAEWILADDEYVEEDLSSGRAADAEGWFRHDNHRTFEGNPKLMAEWIEGFRDAGADAIHMVGIEKLGDFEISDSFAVELPTSGSDRQALFDLYAELTQGEPPPDVGQKYMVLYFD